MLAAGAATRYGAPKQREFLPQVLAAVRASCVDDVVVVAGAHDIETDARVVHCPEWERGPGASLRCGLRELDADAAVVILADGPNLSPQAIDRVVAEWRPGETVAASYGGDRGHPVVIGRESWELVPDEGARSLPARLVPCDDLGSPGDVDFRR